MNPNLDTCYCGSGRVRQLRLDPHPGRLPLHHQQPAHGLALRHRGRSRSERACHRVSARQGPGRLFVDQRHDLHAWPDRGLRWLAPAWQHGVGVAGRAAVFPKVGGLRLRCQYVSCNGRRVASTRSDQGGQPLSRGAGPRDRGRAKRELERLPVLAPRPVFVRAICQKRWKLDPPSSSVDWW